MNYKTSPLFILLLFSGCQSAPEQTQKNELTYFDLKGFFQKESSRLSKSDPVITKTVSVNDSSETKRIHIPDWNKELEIFREADINKTAWKNMFKISKTTDKQQYATDNEKISVKNVTLFYNNDASNEVRGVQIIVKNTNLLYNSTDTLIYFPDSIYQIRKSQNILLLSKKNYQITGKF